MVFSSILFLYYFLPTFLLLYFILKKQSYKNIWLLVTSIFFYAWGASDFILIVLASIVIDFYLVKYIHISENKKRKKLLLAISVLMNIGLLAYFKYANFFIENVDLLLIYFGKSPVQWVRVVLPIGISFFTFQKMTYGIDVYRKVYPPLKKLTDFALYILMFPQLIAGPIVRYNEIAEQIENRQENENFNNRITGFFRFTIGLAKKVLIANVLGEQVDLIFSMPIEEIGTYTAWIGIMAYAFQIYFDFSGYSDMAIGIGRIIGFDFPENFNNPYISQNITEFWRRWHITLGRWMKDYLYIPLGGNRVSVKRIYFNLWIVFLLSGLWHGAAWTFVIWGAFHGFFLVLDRLFLLKFYRWIGKFPSILITFVITLIGWVIFRVEDIYFGIDYIIRMFSFERVDSPYPFDRQFYYILILGGVFAFWAVFDKGEQWQNKIYAKQKSSIYLILMFLISAILLFISSSYIAASGFNPFIYFRF